MVLDATNNKKKKAFKGKAKPKAKPGTPANPKPSEYTAREIVVAKEATFEVKDRTKSKVDKKRLKFKLGLNKEVQFGVYYVGKDKQTIAPDSVCLHLQRLAPSADTVDVVSAQFTIADLETGRVLEVVEKAHKFKLMKRHNKLCHKLDPTICPITKTLSVKVKVRISESVSPRLISPEQKREKLHQDLSTLLSTGLESDLIVVSEDGKEFNAHKLLLVARSEVFAKMLTNDWSTESKENKLKLPFSAKICEQLLQFLYSGEFPCDDDVNTAVSLCEVAHMYQIEDLQQLCEPIMKGNMNKESVVETLMLADRFECLDLKKDCMDFMLDNSKQVLGTQAWKDMAKKMPDLSREFCEFLLRSRNMI